MPSITSRRTIKPLPEEKQWVFDAEVAEVFDDMASRSIPGYYTTQQLSVNLAVSTFRPGARILDIGSATGTTLVALATKLSSLDVTIVGVEPSEPMRAISVKKITTKALAERITVLGSTAESADYSNTSLILFNYTLHFIPKDIRPVILRRAFEGLHQGGALVLGEKFCHEDPVVADKVRRRYHRFKELNGYTKKEILDKEAALSNVLTPLTVCDNRDLLYSAGFHRVEIAFKAPPFVTFVAWKDLSNKKS
jgi:tRNA (cmo5U34)-methyltransferase